MANMQGSAEKGLDEKLMDEYLRANGLYRRKIAKDGSCLFRAVAEQVRLVFCVEFNFRKR